MEPTLISAVTDGLSTLGGQVTTVGIAIIGVVVLFIAIGWARKVLKG